jgi:hypothetical protein
MFRSYKLFLPIMFLLAFQLTANAAKDSDRIKKLSKEADVIVTGKVSKKNSSWNANKTRIYTKATLQVDEYLKGKSNGNSVEITYPGGEVGDVGEIYTHMPSFQANEEVLVFLKKDNKSNSFRVHNGEDGKFKVITDSKTKEKVTGANMSVKALKAQIKTYMDEK